MRLPTCAHPHDNDSGESAAGRSLLARPRLRVFRFQPMMDVKAGAPLKLTLLERTTCNEVLGIWESRRDSCHELTKTRPAGIIALLLRELLQRRVVSMKR